jgi:hypothetical protein
MTLNDIYDTRSRHIHCYEIRTKKNEDELDLDELIEEYNKLTNKYKKINSDKQ